jgi:hypothetical protein
MNEFNVVCRVLGCQNINMAVNIITEEIIPVNVICGPCGTEITDITLIEPLTDIDETLTDIDETLPLIES